MNFLFLTDIHVIVQCQIQKYVFRIDLFLTDLFSIELFKEIKLVIIFYI
jgi:hypothetical protein